MRSYADRDHIDTMVLYPSLGLCAPSNGRLRGIAVIPIEQVASRST